MGRTIEGVFWVAAYLAVILAPLAVMMVSPTPPGRSFLAELSVALAFVALAQTAVQFLLIARYRHVTAPYGIDIILKYHREMGLVAFGLLLTHPILLVVDRPAMAGLLDPLGGTAGTRPGNWALYALVLLVVLSLARKRIGLGYEHWRVSHALLGLAALGLAHGHIHLSARYAATAWKEGVLIAISALLVASFAWLRLGKPAFQIRRPWRVAAVEAERGRTWSLVLEPEGHDGIAFRPGQFAWVCLSRTPYSVEEHPFSFSSSAQAGPRLEFAVEELGDFTSRIGSVEPGRRAWLDGPHGSFSPDRAPAAGYVFFAGGVGIAPFLGILRTMADRGDPRPVLLFYGSPRWEDTPYREALEELGDRLALTVVYVIEEPPEGWTGERGVIDEALLARHLPREGIERMHFVCGPPPMMDAVEEALRARGIPRARIRSERFELV